MGLSKCTEILSGTCPSSHLFGTCKQHQIIFVQIPHTNSQILTPILDLQSIPRELNNKDVAAMLVELTIEANEESFVIVHQHGGNDVTCKSRIQKYQPAICQFVLVAT